MANPNVTIGFKCAPLIGPATTTPTKTANAHAVVITIHPELFPLVSLSTTFATTPLPHSIVSLVPMISAINGVMSMSFFDVYN